MLPGSLSLDGFIEFALERGRLTRAAVRTDRPRPRSIAPDIQAALTFVAGRVRLPDTPADVAMGAVAQFDFIVALTSDERRETLQSVVVDLVSGAPCPSLSRRAWALDVEPDTQPDIGRRLTCPLTEAYDTAAKTLLDWSAPRIEHLQMLVTRRLRDEHARLRLYYRAMVEDLQRRAERAGGERASELRAKVEGTRQEEQAKLSELGEKHRIRPSARLVATRLLTYPRLFATVHLDRKRVVRALELNWDPVIAQLRLPLCEACLSATSHIEMTRGDRLLCPACAADDRER